MEALSRAAASPRPARGSARAGASVMNLLPAVTVAVAAFAATNVDDMMLLGALFAAHREPHAHRGIITGQFCGFGVIVIASAFGGWLIGPLHGAAIGWLGLVPVVVGIRSLASSDKGRRAASDGHVGTTTARVALLTISAGGDNISAYTLLFLSPPRLRVRGDGNMCLRPASRPDVLRRREGDASIATAGVYGGHRLGAWTDRRHRRRCLGLRAGGHPRLASSPPVIVADLATRQLVSSASGRHDTPSDLQVSPVRWWCLVPGCDTSSALPLWSRSEPLGLRVGGVEVASLRFRAGLDLRFRDRAGRERTERFAGGTARRPPEAALDRKAAIERELRHGTCVQREEREAAVADHDARWLSARRIPGDVGARRRRPREIERAAARGAGGCVTGNRLASSMTPQRSVRRRRPFRSFRAGNAWSGNTWDYHWDITGRPLVRRNQGPSLVQQFGLTGSVDNRPAAR